MKLLTFKKGIHPPYHKEATNQKPIEVYMPQKELIFPMQQHIGSPCKPLVQRGEQVFVGQKIGEATSAVSAPIHSSVSGKVLAVEERLSHQGIKVMSVVVENDFKYEDHPTLKRSKNKDYKKLNRNEIIEIVKQAGLVGMGGAAFPTYIKLTPPEDKAVQYIIVNGAECEPYLTSDHRVMLEESERIINGLKILLRVFPKAKVVIGVEDNKRDAFNKLAEAAKKQKRISLKMLHTKYPQGSEKHLIYALTNRQVPSGGLPIDVGCVVFNIDSVVAIWRAVTKGRPIMRRIVTVSGSGVKNPCNLKVRIGTSYRELLEYANWDEENTVKIISGGPMMGQAISNIDVPVTKGTAAILCFTKEDLPKGTIQNCIRCGKCIEVCPMDLLPNVIQHNAIHYEYDQFTENNGMDCIECGCCSYICPAKRELVQSIRTAKSEIRSRHNKGKEN